ncbi:MAG: tyrosine--tRNA ligase [Candidatus Omnitrophota bacterium]
MIIPVEKQIEIIKRGAVEILPTVDELAAKIKQSIETKTPLVVKAGFDPTAPDIHLGHTVLLRKLRHFQELGHKVIFLIGDYTAMIGDPTGVSKTRKMLTRQEIIDNAKTYEKQVSKILNITMERLIERAEYGKEQKAQIRFNSEWFSKMTVEQLIDLASKQTVARILERDDFSKRYKKGDNISFSEFLYPLFQAYDSVALKADIELGGTDQKFNMLMGRDIQERYGAKAQIVMSMPILVGLDGVQKMSKSLSNYIGINEAPKDIFGKVMSVSDEAMFKYYELLTDTPLAKSGKSEAEEKVKSGQLHPKQAKVDLGYQLVKAYYGEEAAKEAVAEFERVFGQKETPKDITVYEFDTEASDWLTLLFGAGLASSKSDARRLLEQGAVKIDGNKVGIKDVLPKQDSFIIQVGKIKFVKVVKK